MHGESSDALVSRHAREGASDEMPAERAGMARLLAVLFGAGGALTLTSLAFPHWSDFHAAPVAGAGAVAVLAGFWVPLAGARMPVWRFTRP
jgi:hypothetical protein